MREEGQRGAADDRGQDGRVGAVKRGRKDRERRGGDRDDPGGKGVHAVDQVHQIGEDDYPEHRQWIAGSAEVVIADQRHRDVVEPKIPADHGNKRDHRHPEQLRLGVETPDIVDQAERGDREGADHDPEIGTVTGDGERSRHRDSGDDCEPSDAGHRMRVHTRAVGRFVQSPDPVSEPCRQGRQQQHDHRRGQKAPDNSAVPDQSVQGVREGHMRCIPSVEAKIGREVA